MAPLREWEEDLKELSSYQPTARRIFWTGANPFVMSFDNLKTRALLVHEYLKECQTMAMFANIRDIKDKKVKQLRALRRLGINGLSIGTESGDNATLRLANKGYTAKDIIDQCRKLDEAGIEYYFVYMTGLAGKGNGHRNAVNSAKVFSKVNPRFISVDSLTLFEGTELYEMAERENLCLPVKRNAWKNCRSLFGICRSECICSPIVYQIFIRLLLICPGTENR